jgi:hypothetical protein
MSWWRALLFSPVVGEASPPYQPDIKMYQYILNTLLHGALMLEGTPTLMLTEQKNVLVEGRSVLNYHGEGPFTYLTPRCTTFTCRCMVL